MVLLRWICVLAAIGIWQPTGARADLIVDSFVAGHSQLNVGGYGNSAPAAGAFGGQRTINMQVRASTQQLVISTATNRLDLGVTVLTTSQNPTFENTLTLTYNDATPSEDLGAANAFAISLADVQATAPWTLTVSFSGTNSLTPAKRTVSIADGFNSSLVIPFNQFDNVVTGLGPISSISLHFLNDSGTAPHLSFGPVTLLTTTAVPEPSVMLLSALSIAGVWVRRRRR